MVRSPSVDKNGLRKGAWSEEEDNKLRAYIQRYGHWNWRQLPKFAGLARCGKSCRLRWLNYLRPGLKKGLYSKEEEEMIIKLREELGNKWSAIAAKLPGRTDNEIKNYWHTHLKKRIKRDPKSTEETNGRSQNMLVMDVKEQDSSTSLFESTDQKMELDAGVAAAADASTEEISSSSYNHTALFGGAENSSSSEESLSKFFESFWTEPFSPSTSYGYSATVLGLEDWVTEHGTSLEESFVKSLENLSTEPVFSNASNGLISPTTSRNSTVTNWEESSADAFCSFWAEPDFSDASNGLISPSASCNSTVTNSDEASADAFEGFWTEPFSLDTSYNKSIHQLPPVEEGVMLAFSPFLDYDVDLLNQLRHNNHSR